MNELLEQIAAIKAETKTLSGQSNTAYLPELLTYFDLMEEILSQGSRHPRYSKEQRLKIAGGFGRIVTEDFAFSQTEIASQMASVVNRFTEEGT